MNLPQSAEIVEEAGEMVAGAAPSSLEAIARPSVALAVWRRRLDAGLCNWLDALDPAVLPDRRFVAPKLMVAEVVEAACAGLPAGPERTALVEDIADLVGRFSEIMAAPALRVRLEAIEGDACRRFHRDAVEARMLCTYRGPATEWGYADPGQQPETIHSLARGEAAMCKGSAWPGAAEHRLAHRSPPIAGTGVSRLLLVVDPADPAKDEAWAAQMRLAKAH